MSLSQNSLDLRQNINILEPERSTKKVNRYGKINRVRVVHPPMHIFGRFLKTNFILFQIPER